tara:strand:- start:4746 stop:4907 length:162 start_codon:yes stop_codon:yes gene_type:complete
MNLTLFFIITPIIAISLILFVCWLNREEDGYLLNKKRNKSAKKIDKFLRKTKF